MKMRSHLRLAAVLVVTGCTASESGLPGISDKHGLDSSQPTVPSGGGGATPGGAAPGTPGASASSLPDLSPVAGKQLTSKSQVLDDGPFNATAPTIRANDRHSAPVTGKNCLDCHGAGGPAPHFAFGGSIALGKGWVTGTPPWSTNPAAQSSSTNYDDDDDSYGGGYGDDYGGYGGACGDDDDDYGGGYGGGYGDDDDYGGYGGGCSKPGWPSDRTTPAPGTGVRLVGADGMIFDAVADADGNFWFKTPGEVQVPAYTGIKYGSYTVTGDTNGVACASCHENGAPDSPGRLWVLDSARASSN